MSQNVDRATRDLFSSASRVTCNIKYYYRANSTADQLADYRTRAWAQIENGDSKENLELDKALLD